MPTQVKFDINTGVSLVDSKTGSQYSIPTAACVDLLNCGSTTHIEGAVSFNIQSINDCVERQFLQFSARGLIALSTQELESFTATANGVQLSITAGKLVSFSLQPSATEAQVRALFGNPQLKFISRGSTLSLVTSTDRRMTATVQRPYSVSMIDTCGTEYGRKYLTSASVYGTSGLNPGKLLWQLSTSLMVSNQYTDAAIAVTDALVKLRASKILEAVASSISCNTLINSVEGQWIPLLNTTLNLG